MTQSDLLARARQLLTEEMELSHAAILGLHKFTDDECYRDIKGNYWLLAARLMSAQVGAANALQRLSGARDRFTFTYMHQGTPTRQKLKTNGPEQPVLEGCAPADVPDAAADV